MLLVPLLAAILLQTPIPPVHEPASDTAHIYDHPATQALVERAILSSGLPPTGLNDYRAKVRTSMFATLASDSTAGGPGGDIPASVDELVSEVQWSREGYLRQEVQGHRVRLLVPLPYTLATLFQQPWLIPHLYGTAAQLQQTAFAPFAGTRAVHPFGASGPDFYRYQSGDTVRIRLQGEELSLVPITVRPRQAGTDERALVLGTFYLDLERGAVARARFGFSGGGGGGLPAALGRLETFWELENALWQGKYWLPYTQRRDIIFHSRALGTAVTARTVSRFQSFELNTGLAPSGRRSALVWNLGDNRTAFQDWNAPVGEEAAEYSTEDFADLRLATSLGPNGESSLRPRLHYQRASHLFRYNRVEGAYLGLGARLLSPDWRARRWELYGTAGWAFAEGTPRGELGARAGAAVAADRTREVDYGLEGATYRRLRDIQPFRPSFQWDWIHTLPALFWGSDERDYYDATGVELFGSARRGRLGVRVGGRYEAQDSVRRNTTRFLFGRAGEFPPLAGVEPGHHASLESSLSYTLGAGAFGIGNSLVLGTDLEQGFADFRFTRLTGLLSGRYELGPMTLAARGDVGHVVGGAPPQKLFRFGSVEGLRGYEPNEFGGSTAALARARLLLGLPPRSNQPLARFDVFVIPPLRPSLVLLGESGWTRVEPQLADELARLGSRPSGEARSSLGLGISILEDAFTVEYLHPVGPGAAERKGRWYIGMVTWY